MRKELDKIPGIKTEIKAQEGGPPTGKDIEIRVLGPSRSSTMTVAQDIKSYLNSLDGLVNLESTLPVPGVEWELFVDKPKAAKFGADIPTIGNSIGLITSGLTIGSYRPKDIDEELDIVLRYPEKERYIDELENILINTESGMVPISNFVEKQFLKRGIKVYKNHSLLSIKEKGSSFEAKLKNEDKILTLEFEKAILAIGIVGNIENLNLEGISINCSNGSILVDEYCRTNVDNIYAIGDVASPPWLAHKASHEGIAVAEQIAGFKVHPINKDKIPACTYCDPEVASIGLTEKEADKKGFEFKVGTFPFSANGKALAMGYEEGFIKTIIDKNTGEFLGVHMVGMGVTELIHNYALAKEAEIIQENIENTIFPHPTLSEAIHESVLKASGREIHI